MKHTRTPKYTVELKKPSMQRMAAIIRRGDTLHAFVHYRKGGFFGDVLVTAVYHWGVYAVIRGDEAIKQSRHFVRDYYEGMVKRQFKIKWPCIHSIICTAPDEPFVPKPKKKHAKPVQEVKRPRRGKYIHKGIKLDGYFVVRCDTCGFENYLHDLDDQTEHECPEPKED